MASATASNVIQGQSLKSHFMQIWELALLVQSFDNFSKKCCLLLKPAIPWLEWGQLDGFVEQSFNFAKIMQFFEEINDINRANTQIGTKCDFRDWPRITFEAVADAMFA